MNSIRILVPLCLLAFLSVAPLSAQDSNESEQKSLTYQKYPSRFNSSNPLTHDFEQLLQFNEPVSPDAVAASFRAYDKSNERFATLKARRPTAEEVTRFRKYAGDPTPIETLVLITPASQIPVGGSWYLNARSGMASLSGTHTIVESRLDYLGSLYPFQVDHIEARNAYDEEKVIQIRHNKRELHADFDDARIAEFVSVSPTPANLEVKNENYLIIVTGDFAFGVEYTVTVENGIIAYDKTQLNQKASEVVKFEPNPGFITLPAFTTTQNASGHRRFDVKTGNLTGMRTRVKKLEGNDLILAMTEYADNYEGWGEEQSLAFTTVPGSTIYDEFRESDMPIDVSETVSLDWDAIAEGAASGSYYLCTEGRSSTRDKLEVGAQAIIQLTDIGLAWKQATEETVLYAFSLKSGKPLSGTALRLLDETGKPLAETRTNEDGIATVSSQVYRDPEGRLYLDAQKDSDRHVMQFFEDLQTVGLWRFSVNQRYDDLAKGERRTLLFTDRNIYKPGDEVKVKAISRFIDEDKLLGPGAGVATFRVFDARHRKILEKEVTVGAKGSFDDSFQLPSAGMGWHSIELDFNPRNSEDHPNWRLVANHSFQVEEYRVNTFEITLDNEPNYIGSGQIEVPLSARYYMGKPLSKAELQWNVYARNSYPYPRGFDEFQFGDLTIDRERWSDEGTASLTSTGTASIAIDLPEQKTSPSPRAVSLTTQVTDANQQTISQSARFTVHSSDFYLGIREPDGVHRAGDTATFSIAAVTTEGEAHPASVPVTVLLEKEIWNTVKVLGANGRYTHRNDRRLQMVSEEAIALETQVDPETGLTKAQPHEIKFEEAGSYVVTLTARDKEDRPVVTKIRFNVIGAEEPSWSWYDVIRIDLTPDQESYKPGDTAKLLVRSPVFGSALLTTERGGVRSTQAIEINNYETVVEIPIGQDDAPNVFASLMIIRGSEDSPHIHTSADYRLGYCRLNVDDPATHLDIVIDAGEAEYYQPGEAVEVTATVTDSTGGGTAGAEVTFWAVDEGVLSLTAFQTPQPHDEFHKAFPLSVFTGQSLSELLPENPKEQDFMNKGYVIGGGGATLGLDPDRVRKDFKALAFWEPTLRTDENGIVRATFVAPDNLTEFRIMAVVAEGNRFGHADAPVVINKPLIIEPALPVFSNITDQIDVSSVLHNNTNELQEVEVSVQLDDHATFVRTIGEKVPTQLGDETDGSLRIVKAILEPGATETLSFPLALTTVGDAKWTWKVRSLTDETLRDATESTLPVGYPLPLLRESHSFTLREGESLEEALRQVAPRLLEGVGEVHVTLSNSRLVEAGDALDYLLGYPYGCVEQTTSSVIPWLTSNELRKVLPQLDKTEEEARKVATKGIQRLFSMQTGDGGLAYWPGGTKSTLWGSAYGAVAIALAQDQGIEVPQEQAKALWNYLSKNLRNTAELERSYDLSQRCLASFALALADVNETAYHSILFEKRKQLSAEARSLLALAMIESETDTPDRIGTLLSPDPQVPVAEVSWYKSPYIAATRLLAEVKHNPRSERIDDLVDDLMKLRQVRNGWGSTYSNAWPLIALAAYSDSAAGSVAANDVAIAFAGDEQTVKLPAEPGSQSLQFPFDGLVQTNALSLKPSASSKVYASVTVETRPKLVPIQPENSGFSIQRTYEKVNVDGSIAAAEDLKIGDLILVTLDVNIPNERETYLAIDDPLPAIFEAVNPSFKTQATQKVNTERSKRRLYTNYREIQKDRVLFFADSIYRAGDYSVQYLARVVAPGEVTAPPAKIEAMYEPQRFGLSGTERISAGPLPMNSGKVATR